MHPVGFGISWLAIVLGLGGGLGLPLGMPPLPEDPITARIAPEECLAYISSAGMATPDAASANQTEQLLAEPEVGRLAEQIERAVRAALAKAKEHGGPPPGVTSNEAADAIKLLLTRPLAAYVSSAPFGPGGPEARGGAVVNLGDGAPKFKAIVERLAEQLPPPGAETVEIDGRQWQSLKLTHIKGVSDITIVWGFKDEYLLIGVGEGEIEAMLTRAQGNPPGWLTQLREQLPVQRTSTTAFFNVKAIKDLALPMFDSRTARTFEALGLDNVTAFASVTGLDEKACVNKTLLSIDGEPKGVLQLAGIEPLTAADLTPIPQDATLAVAFKLDPEKTFDVLRSVAGKIDARAAERMDREIGKGEEHIGFRLREDILRPLGDTWCLFDSPSEGGLLTGLTLVVTLKDAKQAAETNARLLELVSGRTSQKPYRPLSAAQFAGKEIHVFNPGGRDFPFAPSWCVTDKELIVSLFPQSIKAYLSRPADFKSLAAAPEVAEQFTGDAGPVKLAFCNTQRVFDLLYPVVSVAAPKIMYELRRGGVELDPLLLPSARAIRGHLTPAVATVRRTNAGIEIIQRHSLPSGGMVSAAPVAIGVLLPRVSHSRAAARRMQSMNNMKQIALAMLNYEFAHKKFPPAYKVDKDGKPLLSWRVLILPYLEGQNLYHQFHLDEPWDSEHNKQLIAQMPAFYKSPKSKVANEGKTNYLTIRSDKSVFPGKDGVSFHQITDGISNTIMTVEVADSAAVIWTKPDDFEYDEKDPKKGLVGMWPGGFIAGLTDGSVRFLPVSLDAKTLNALFTRDGGEPVAVSELDR